MKIFLKNISETFFRGFRAGVLVCAAAFVLFPTHAQANNPANDSDQIVIRITPHIDVGVEIDTAAVNLNFTMTMGATEYTVTPATVTVVGTINPQELDISGANVAPAPVWTLDGDEVSELDELQLYALFSIGRSSHPLESEFAGVKNLITAATKRIGTLSGTAANANFENNVMEGGADMDSLSVGNSRQMWFRIDTPAYTSTTQEQQIQVTITATRSNMQ